VGSSSGDVAETIHLEVECVDCRTWGTALITTSGVTKDENIIGDIVSFFQNPIDTIVSAFDLDVKISFENVGGHFEFDISASDTVSYSFPIFSSDTIAGLAVSEDVSVGLVLFIDLVFSLTAEIDVEAGFEFSFPDGAYVTVDPLGGNIIDHGLYVQSSIKSPFTNLDADTEIQHWRRDQQPPNHMYIRVCNIQGCSSSTSSSRNNC